MINTIWLTHGRMVCRGSAGPICSSPRSPIWAFCVGMLALVVYFVWASVGHPARARHARVRDNELAAGVVGIDIFRTKVSAFALSAVLGGLPAGCRRRICLCQPGSVSRSPSRWCSFTMSLLGGVASPIGRPSALVC